MRRRVHYIETHYTHCAYQARELEKQLDAVLSKSERIVHVEFSSNGGVIVITEDLGLGPPNKGS